MPRRAESQVRPRTFIFPWNRENHFEVLRRMGFKTYRGKERVIGPPDHSMGLWNERPVFYVDQKSYGAESLMMKYADLCAGPRRSSTSGLTRGASSSGRTQIPCSRPWTPSSVIFAI